jgi:diguanylate cyclase (GGDEF)-like protein
VTMKPNIAERRSGRRGSERHSEPTKPSLSATPAAPPSNDPAKAGGGARQGEDDPSGLLQLHESIAELLASRGQWRAAYHHLRSALDLLYTAEGRPPRIPEQVRLRREVARLRKERAEAREQSLRDSLTASYNRRYLDQRLVSLLTDHNRQPEALAIALVDLDWFKQVNDTYGHPVGDRVLQQVVNVLQDGLPRGAFCARYGGEEFVLVLPRIDPATAVAVCENARKRVQDFPWGRIANGLRVTVSIGLAHGSESAPPADRATTVAEQQLLIADGLLYTAKESGRNAVAYRMGGQVMLGGPAGGRRSIATSRPVGAC